jgi:hypothetical protein
MGRGRVVIVLLLGVVALRLQRTRLPVIALLMMSFEYNGQLASHLDNLCIQIEFDSNRLIHCQVIHDFTETLF